jgi:death-on-curing protein
VTRTEPRWVPRLVVEAAHLDQIREHGGLIGIRDENALESALARAQQRWSYEPDAPLPRLAADYAFGIARNHPFRDGNKRTAFLAAVVFLGLNDQRLEATEEDVVDTMLRLASGKLDEHALASWFEDHVEPR